jgi:hypothetical protein
MKTELLKVIPVLPSQDIDRDTAWYREKVGFETYFSNTLYAVIYRKNIFLHLQWHADTEDDPLLGGSVIRILVKNIRPLFEELVKRGTIAEDKYTTNTAWGTNEFGFLTSIKMRFLSWKT